MSIDIILLPTSSELEYPAVSTYTSIHRVMKGNMYALHNIAPATVPAP